MMEADDLYLALVYYTALTRHVRSCEECRENDWHPTCPKARQLYEFTEGAMMKGLGGDEAQIKEFQDQVLQVFHASIRP